MKSSKHLVPNADVDVTNVDVDVTNVDLTKESIDQVPVPASFYTAIANWDTSLAQPYDVCLHEPLKARFENLLEAYSRKSRPPRLSLKSCVCHPENRGQSSSSAAPSSTLTLFQEIRVEEAQSQEEGEHWIQTIGEDADMGEDCSQDTEMDRSKASTLYRWALDEGL